MVVGATTSGVFLVAYVLAMEMVGPKFRFGFLINCLPGRMRNANWAAIRHMLRLNSPILRNCAASLLLAAFIDALVLNSEEVIRSQNINFCSLFFS